MQQVYFDNAATTSLLPEVVAGMVEVMQSEYGNPSSSHGVGRSAKQHIETTRKNSAKLLNVEARELIFTSGATEANAMILQSAVRDLKITAILSSRIEHHAVLDTITHLSKEQGIKVHYVDVQEDGHIDYVDLEALLSKVEGNALVSLMHVNNEIGTLLDMNRVGQLCQQYKALFHCDMVQSIGHLPVSLSTLPVDFATISAHKFHGPKGVGFAYIRRNTGIRAILHGGLQERGYRGGTEGVHNIVGMGIALQKAYECLDADRLHITALQSYCKAQLMNHIPGVIFNGIGDSDTEGMYTILNVSFPFASETSGILLFHLDLNGIACSKGSACQSGSTKDSHVLSEFLTPEALSRPYLRFSFSKFNTLQEVDYVVGVLKEFGAK